ncbi:hypothetical protein [Pedobacter punctiformis]|uniref:Uncharacterized protein n=1 Tax=Pedobacter punctiformis TaxID=3004097 RepID=A0ABT4LBZ8_9SPHI|nr:hypothetical protein [Pedobacter sp. HCMS5-2]MCZ4245439.1 hypothetical protein [Pedobacter sp. HCMS5-2]
MRKINALSLPFKAIGLYFIALLLVISACKKDNLSNEKLSSNELSVLKDWQSKNFNQKSLLFSSMTPNWNQVYVNELKDQTVYEIDLISSIDAFITNDIVSKNDKQNHQIKSKIKLLIFKDHKSGQITDGYYMASVSNDLLHYKEVDNFTGTIYFYNKIGNFVNGWVYDRGKMIVPIVPGTEAGHRESVNAALKEKINMNDFGNGRIQVSAQQFCYTGQTPIYGESCIQPEGSQAPVCSTYIKGYNYTRFCVDVEIPTDGAGGLIPDPNNPRGQQPVPGTLPIAPDDGNPPKNYGTDPNCLNCVVPVSVFEQLLADSRAAGLTVSPPKPNTTVTLPDGSKYVGTIIEIKDANGDLVVSFFTPNVNAGPFTVGYQYNIGGKGPDGTGNPNNYTPVFYGPSGQPIIFNPVPPLGGGATPVTYTFDASYYYSEAEMLDIISSIQDPITGNGIELYLIVQYKGSKLFNLGSRSTSNTIEVGTYTLMPFYNSSGGLSFYTASRLGTGGNKNGVEYLIKADQVNNFRTNVEYYTSAADLVYMNGTPTKGMIQLMAGDRVSGLLNLWGESIKSPSYWIYLATLYVTNPTSASVRTNALRSVEAAVQQDVVVLGHYPEYVALAEELAAKRFEIPLNIWKEMSDPERWIANQKFLDRAISRGSDIILATPINKVRPGSYFEKELNYLFSKGYRVSSDGRWLIK